MKYEMHSNVHSIVNDKSFAVFIYQAIINKLARLSTRVSGSFDYWTDYNLHDDQQLKEIRNIFNDSQAPAHVNPRAWRRHSALLSSWEEQRRQ